MLLKIRKGNRIIWYQSKRLLDQVLPSSIWDILNLSISVLFEFKNKKKNKKGFDLSLLCGCWILELWRFVSLIWIVRVWIEFMCELMEKLDSRFYTRVIVDKYASLVIIDDFSCNLIFSYAVEKLGLSVIDHPCPYEIVRYNQLISVTK